RSMRTWSSATWSGRPSTERIRPLRDERAREGGAALSAELASRVGAARAAGRAPLAVLDVDLTLIENAPRTRAIFVDWLHGVRRRWPGAEEALVRAQTMPIVFSVKDNVAALGVPPELAREAMLAWREGFFTSHYCRRDAPLPGAV